MKSRHWRNRVVGHVLIFQNDYTCMYHLLTDKEKTDAAALYAWFCTIGSKQRISHQ